MFVVAGASGRTGRLVAEILTSQGKAVRAIVRDPAKAPPRTEVVRATLEDRSALTNALSGAHGLYLVLPENLAAHDLHAERRLMIDSISAAVKQSAVPHVVLLSAVAAALPEGNGPARDLHDLENALRATGTILTAVRASYRQENVLAALGPATAQGIYPCFLPPDASIPTVATRDIAAVAARCLLEPPKANEIIDLVGPMYSTRQLAEKLGEALGKSLHLIEIPPAAQVDALTGAGLSRSFAEALVEMYAAFAAGRIRPSGDRMLAGSSSIEDTIREALQ